MPGEWKLMAEPRAVAGKDGLKKGNTFVHREVVLEIIRVGTRVRDRYPVRAKILGDHWDNFDIDIGPQDYRFEVVM